MGRKKPIDPSTDETTNSADSTTNTATDDPIWHYTDWWVDLGLKDNAAIDAYIRQHCTVPGDVIVVPRSYLAVKLQNPIDYRQPGWWDLAGGSLSWDEIAWHLDKNPVMDTDWMVLPAGMVQMAVSAYLHGYEQGDTSVLDLARVILIHLVERNGHSPQHPQQAWDTACRLIELSREHKTEGGQ